MQSNSSRRNFLKNFALTFTILPSAGRIWKAVIDPRSIPNPDYVPCVERVYYMRFDVCPGLVFSRQVIPNPPKLRPEFKRYLDSRNLECTIL